MYQIETLKKNWQDRKRTGLVFILALIAGALTGCGKFQTQTGQEFNNLTSQSSMIKAPQSRIATSDGIVSWTTTDTAVNVELNFDLKIPFGRVYRAASTVVKWVAPMLCQAMPGIEVSPISSYRAGEIPCGTVTGSNYKEILQINANGQSGSADGFDYSVSGFNLPVLVDRNQKTGNYSEASLDSKTTVNRQTSVNFGDDISIRFTPSGQNGKWEICANIPGTTVTSNPTTLYASAKKNLWLFDLNFGSSLNVTPGHATYDYGRACFAVDFGWAGPGKYIKVAAVPTVNPHLVNASYGGLNIEINDWFLNLIDNVMDWFDSSIRRSAEQQLAGQANGFIDSDVKTGAWFGKIHGANMVTDWANRATSFTSNIFTRIGVPSSSDDLKKMITDSCNRFLAKGGEAWTKELQIFCKDIIPNIELTVEPFSVDSSSRSAGCYDYFARIHDSKDSVGNEKWWSKNCQFAAKIKIGVPLKYKIYIDQIKLLLANRVVLDRIPQNILALYSKWNLDEFTLLLVLEELDRRGIRPDSQSQVNSVVPEIIKSIRGLVAGS